MMGVGWAAGPLEQRGLLVAAFTDAALTTGTRIVMQLN